MNVLRFPSEPERVCSEGGGCSSLTRARRGPAAGDGRHTSWTNIYCAAVVSGRLSVSAVCIRRRLEMKGNQW